MTQVVWRFEIPTSGHRQYIVAMPKGARILSAGYKDEKIVIWALCETKAKMVDRHIPVFYTSEVIQSYPTCMPFIGTARDGEDVFHVFDGGESHE